MKKLSIAVIAIVVLAVGFFTFSSPESQKADGPQVRTAQTQKAPNDFHDVQLALDRGGQLLDVRTPEEYATGHIQGAANLSLQDIQAGKLPSGSKTQAIFLYCHSGNRAGQAMTILKNAGYTDVTNLGALTHVQSIGGAMITGP